MYGAYGGNQTMVMDMESKKDVSARLRRVGGQLQAIERMVEADRQTADLLHQISAVQAALSKVGKMILRSHVARSIVEASAVGGDERERRHKLDELTAVFERYGQIRER